RLLSGQDMADTGIKIDPLSPGRVRTLFNTQIESQAFSVFACEFDTKWIESALENGRYPLTDAPEGHADHMFRIYGGATTDDDPAWLKTRLSYDLKQPDKDNAAEDIISHEQN
ncbi:phage protein Gp37, partial [Enterobacter roggenkampii]